jgi:voltage-gated potassium channel
MSERLADLDPRDRRRVITLAIGRVSLVWVTLFGGYYLLPVSTFEGRHVPLILIAGSVLFVGVVAWQVRQIGRAKIPGVRAVVTLGMVIPFFLLLFASFYLSLDATYERSFSQHLDHTGSVYFTVTVFATVGFGDIVPVTALARLVTSVQMLLDLVVLGAVVRIVILAARRRIG